ncbi:MAG TPA: Hsp33 family molecular chaperone HslO [Polyangia bacterium]|jgi:molecular chaperone Hsp33|nr:Hsp33 family molecular chaperone HslO [Polyangia bacterium]
MSDVLVRTIDRASGVRVVAALTTELVREAARRHHASGLGACALGRALTSSLLLATLTKGGERVTVQIRGDGPLGGVTADATDNGEVRGYLLRPEAATAPAEGRARVAEVLGRNGVVNVLRDLGLKERYAGQVSLTTGEIDEDVEAYLRVSEQVPSALGCEIIVNDGRIQMAGGMLVQSLPDGAPELVRESQHALRSGQLWELLQAGGLSAHRLAELIYGQPLELLDERPVRFQCRCSRARVNSSLATLSVTDLDEIIADEGQAEVTCNFCNERYVIGRAELESIRASVAHGPRQSN